MAKKPHTKRPKAKIVNDSAESESDDSPETILLSQAKNISKQQTAAIQKAHEAQKEKTRVRNRERDQRLKAQAQNRKQRREGEARFENTIADVEKKTQDATNDQTEDGSKGLNLFTSINEETTHEDADGKGNNATDGSMEEDEFEDEPMGAFPSMKLPNHLPDDLFATAFSAQAAEKAKSEAKASKRKASTSDKRKRMRSNASPKDVLIGSRAIRTLSQDPYPSGSGTIPSSKIKRFLNRVLALKGSKSRTRGWERKPANIGVFKRNGPAPNFVRKKTRD